MGAEAKTNSSQWESDLMRVAVAWECGDARADRAAPPEMPHFLRMNTSLVGLAAANEKALHKSLAEHRTPHGDDGHESKEK